MANKHCFDAKCLDLAIYFYPAASADRLNDLAQRIQNEVESEDLDASAQETPSAPLKRLRDCWRCGEAQDLDENPMRCPNCEAPNPCGEPR